MRLSTALAVLLASTCSCPSQAENRRPVYLSSIAAPLPVAVPGIRPTVQSPQYSKHYEQGLAFKKAGDGNRALIEFLQAIKENPRCTKAFYEQALLFRQKGYPKLAESSLCQALAIDPSFRDARILLAAVRLEAGNTGGAAQELTRSLGLSASHSPAQSPAQSQPLAATNATPAPGQSKATAKTAAVAPPSVPQSSTPATSEINQRKNSLQFIPEGSSLKDSPNPDRTATTKSQASRPIDNDDWAKRLRYLSIHGTGTLKAGEAFMFSEETGEAVIFLTNGTRIRRIITAPQDTHELVKARRPDMLIPADLLYKLSTLGKLVASDPAALIDTNAAENPDLEPAKKKEYFDADLDSEDQAEDSAAKKSSKHKPEKGTLGELMDSNEETDNSDNKFTHKVILEDSPRDKASSPIIPNDATKGPNLDSTEPSSMKDFNKDPVNDSLLDKTQKLFGWFKKALHLPN